MSDPYKPGETLAEEWTSYVREVLAPNGIDPQTAEFCRRVFYSGAGSGLCLIANGTPIMTIREEIADHAEALLRGMGATRGA